MFLLFISTQTSFASIQSHILDDINSLKGNSFQHLIQKWEKKYGTKSIDRLISITENKKNKDQNRYIAMMAAVKIGGEAVIPKIEKLATDPSWMVRLGVLKAIRATKKTTSSEILFNALNDPAIVVRNEAVITIDQLNLPNSASQLMKTLNTPHNQYPKVPLWLVENILSVIAHEKGIKNTEELKKFIDQTPHPKLIKKGIQTLELVQAKN